MQIWDARHIAIQKLEIREEHIYQYIDIITSYFVPLKHPKCRLKYPGGRYRLPTRICCFHLTGNATKRDEDTVDEDLGGNINELTHIMFFMLPIVCTDMPRDGVKLKSTSIPTFFRCVRYCLTRKWTK